ncbi:MULTISPECIES: hypothetical protein [unclassified Pseudomonas]|uniref:hypothetical protein n=1 Tax=unclassified Pseudomonas TaxID=196821 RepID=UPI0024475FE4|nr:MULTISPECIES: hypothetical protein [unclassified Pseudomonas]MDG9923213.1 hypothetical protein [Pseudomonas sp. GD04045]MDH0034710.1 hypothetical protein [Pseudomonas sp. GD04019]
MQINGYSGTLPPSTQVINKYGPANPEQVNKVVDATSDRVAERQESRELSQAAKRDAATQIYSANTQQRQIETYLAVASEGEVESQPTPLETATELREAQERNDRAQNIADIASRPERPENEPARPEPYAATYA